MTPSRRRIALLVAPALVGSFGACASSAVGVDECRRIEEARCRAAARCDVGLDSKENVDVCIRFSADNCLHGLPLEDEPKPSAVDLCVATIASASCDVVEEPEKAPECAFLVPDSEPQGTGGGSNDAAAD